MSCLFCLAIKNSSSKEHIVPESFGNKHYLLDKGIVCDDCNNRFSKFEGVALTNSVYVMERCRLGIATKKGRPAKGKVNELVIEADNEFRKSIINVKGLTEANVKNIDPKTGRFQLIVSAFDKSESAASKLYLTMGLEALYHSQHAIFKKYDFTILRDYILNKNTKDWPFIDSKLEPSKFTSIPTFYDKHLLNKIDCRLLILEYSKESLLFKFQYGGVVMVINLLDRNLNWIKDFVKVDKKSAIHPKHFRKKVASLIKK